MCDSTFSTSVSSVSPSTFFPHGQWTTFMLGLLAWTAWTLVQTLAPGVPLGARPLVLVDVEVGVADGPEDLAALRHLRRVDVLLRVPEIRADQRLRALRVRLLDRHHDPEARPLPV